SFLSLYNCHFPSSYFFFLRDSAPTHLLLSSPTRRSSDLRRSSARPRPRRPRPSSPARAGGPSGSRTSSRRARSCRPATTYDYLKGRKSTRLNSSHDQISYAVFCLKKKKKKKPEHDNTVDA